MPEEDDNWQCFLMLWSICGICTAFEVTEEDSIQLAWIIEMHHELYTKVYGKEKITPKMHFMVHLPAQMRRFKHIPSLNINIYTQQTYRFGPLRFTWCTRFEGKNSQTKSYLHGNFKNVPFSVATRHQEWLCSVLLSAPGETSPYLTLGDQYSGNNLVYYVYVKKI